MHKDLETFLSNQSEHSEMTPPLEKRLFKLMFKNDKSDFSVDDKIQFLKSIIYINQDNVERIDEILKIKERLLEEEYLIQKDLDFLAYKQFKINEINTSSISEDNDNLNYAFNKNSPLFQYKDDSEFVEKINSLDEIHRIFPQTILKHTESVSVESSKLNDGYDNISTNVNLNAETPAVKAPSIEKPESSKDEEKNVQKNQNDTDYIKEVYRDIDYWKNSFRDKLKAEGMQNSVIYDVFDEKLTKAKNYLSKRFLNKEEDESHFLNQSKHKWGHKLYKFDEDGSEKLVLELPTFSKKVIMSNMPDYDDPAKNEKQYELLAIAARTRGIKKPTITCKETSTVNREEFVAQTLKQLLAVDYNLDDISVPRDMIHIKEKFRLSQGIEETADLSDVQKIVNNQESPKLKDSDPDSTPTSSNAKSFENGYDKEELLQQGALSSENKSSKKPSEANNEEYQNHQMMESIMGNNDFDHDYHNDQMMQSHMDNSYAFHDYEHDIANSYQQGQKNNEYTSTNDFTKNIMGVFNNDFKNKSGNEIFLEMDFFKERHQSEIPKLDMKGHKILNERYATLLIEELIDEASKSPKLKDSKNLQNLKSEFKGKLNSTVFEMVDRFTNELSAENLPKSESIQQILSGKIPNEDLKINQLNLEDLPKPEPKSQSKKPYKKKP